LRELERDALITRKVFAEVPPRVEYALSDWGVDLNAALSTLADWGEVYAKATGRYPQ
jgi:DNA-binding HxlR family transcriptional regulator